jgi:NAD(P)-dependent dehydrogenase (short-subunit alcohol dehydrogenase family)
LRFAVWEQCLRGHGGVFLGTNHAIMAMKQHPPNGGSIIILSSIEGLVSDPNLGAYNASKGGVRLYTKSVTLYCAKERLNISANSLIPATSGHYSKELPQGA